MQGVKQGLIALNINGDTNPRGSREINHRNPERLGRNSGQNKSIMKAIWNNQVIAESDDTILIENNHYFPADSIRKEYFKPSETHSTCPWKGLASYYSLEVDGKENKDAAWYYPEPKELAQQIKGYVAFWKGVEVVD